MPRHSPYSDGGDPKGASRILLAFLTLAMVGCQDGGNPTVTRTIELVEKFVVSDDSADLGRRFQAAQLGSNYVFARSTLSGLALRTDSTGKVIGFLGPKGVGPNELAYVGPMMAKGDSLMVMDPAASRIAVVSPEGEIVRTVPTKTHDGQFALRLRGDTILMAMTVGSEDAFGYPLHLVGPGGDIVRSFGTDDRSVDPANAEAKLRVLLAESDSTFWAAHVYAYVLEHWHINGTLLHRLEPSRDWFQRAPLNTAAPARRPGVITAGVLDNGRLAVVLFRPQADWKPVPAESLKHGVTPPSPQRLAGANSYVLEVLDPQSGALEGSRPITRDVIRGFLPHDRLFGIREQPDGSQHAVVWQIKSPQP